MNKADSFWTFILSKNSELELDQACAVFALIK